MLTQGKKKGQVGWQNITKGGERKKKLAQHHLNDKAGVNSATDRLMMGKSEASSVHI